MRQLLRLKNIFSISIIASTSAFISCNKDMDVSLGTPNDAFSVSLVDSMTVNTSTFQLLNLPSAGMGTILVGQAEQNDIGKVKSSSYFKLAFEDLYDGIPTNATFDSVNVVLKPNNAKYFYGDTTNNQTISVHRVTEEIVTKNLLNQVDAFLTPVYASGATIFTDTKFNYDASALGTATFSPKVRSIDKINIKLENAFGQDLFDKIKANEYIVSTQELLQNYIKGLVLKPGNNNTAVLGLNDSVSVNINYTYIGNDGFKTTGKKTLTTGSRSFQYNNIEYDRSATLYATLDDQNRELKSSETNNKVYIQSGTGTVAKISIPSLAEFMAIENIAVNKAELIIETESTNTGLYTAPNALMLLVAKNDIPVSYIRTPFSTTIQQASFIPGNNVGLNARYVFNMLEYVKNINANQYRDASLLIASSASFATGTSSAPFITLDNGRTNAAVIATENGKPKIKLNIVYTKFK